MVKNDKVRFEGISSAMIRKTQDENWPAGRVRHGTRLFNDRTILKLRHRKREKEEGMNRPAILNIPRDLAQRPASFPLQLTVEQDFDPVFMKPLARSLFVSIH